MKTEGLSSLLANGGTSPEYVTNLPFGGDDRVRIAVLEAIIDTIGDADELHVTARKADRARLGALPLNLDGRFWQMMSNITPLERRKIIESIRLDEPMPDFATLVIRRRLRALSSRAQEKLKGWENKSFLDHLSEVADNVEGILEGDPSARKVLKEFLAVGADTPDQLKIRTDVVEMVENPNLDIRPEWINSTLSSQIDSLRVAEALAAGPDNIPA